MRVRSFAHHLGLRFRVCVQRLPGSPDLVFARRGVCIFVHGCFWHRHPNCARASRPKTNQPFWDEKFENNVARDRRKAIALRKLGWTVATLWECETENDRKLEGRLRRIFGMPSSKDAPRTTARARADFP
jgi:DNA mismatch endonuclease (patch repair protein)